MSETTQDRRLQRKRVIRDIHKSHEITSLEIEDDKKNKNFMTGCCKLAQKAAGGKMRRIPAASKACGFFDRAKGHTFICGNCKDFING